MARTSIGGAATSVPQERRYASQPRENHGIRQNGRGAGMRQPAESTELEPVIGTVSKKEVLRHAPLVAVHSRWCAGNAQT